MELIEVDPISPQPRRAVAARWKQRGKSKMLGRALGGDKPAAAYARHGATHHRFGAIGLGRVDEECAAIQSSPEKLRSAVVVRGSQTDFRNRYAGVGKALDSDHRVYEETGRLSGSGQNAA